MREIIIISGGFCECWGLFEGVNFWSLGWKGGSYHGLMMIVCLFGNGLG
jgi:hypothetical protein